MRLSRAGPRLVIGLLAILFFVSLTLGAARIA
jgi:hypothetical protein